MVRRGFYVSGNFFSWDYMKHDLFYLSDIGEIFWMFFTQLPTLPPSSYGAKHSYMDCCPSHLIVTWICFFTNLFLCLKLLHFCLGGGSVCCNIFLNHNHVLEARDLEV